MHGSAPKDGQDTLLRLADARYSSILL